MIGFDTAGLPAFQFIQDPINYAAMKDALVPRESP